MTAPERRRPAPPQDRPQHAHERIAATDASGLWSNVSPAALAALLGRLPLSHPLSVAARTGLEMAERRVGVLLQDDYCGGRYHREHPLTGPGELALRRWPPTGNRELWIAFGPAGPPPGYSPQVDVA